MSISALLTGSLVSTIKSAPMPKYIGTEPSQIDIQRIRKMVEENRFNELSKPSQDWVCYRLMPSLTRYGVYPLPAQS